MITKTALARVALLVTGFACLGVPPSLAQVPTVRVGVVLDEPSQDAASQLFQDAIVGLAQPEFNVQFPSDKQRLADFTLAGVRRAVDGLLADPEVDLVLTLGPIASAYACRLTALPKPVVAAFVLDPEVQGIPISAGGDGERVSGVANLSYITFPGDIATDVRRFRELAPFDRLAYIDDAGLLEAIPDLVSNVLEEIEGLELEIQLVPVGASIAEALAAIGPDVDAVYVAPLLRLSPGDFDLLVRGLIERRLPSFSL